MDTINSILSPNIVESIQFLEELFRVLVESKKGDLKMDIYDKASESYVVGFCDITTFTACLS